MWVYVFTRVSVRACESVRTLVSARACVRLDVRACTSVCACMSVRAHAQEPPGSRPTEGKSEDEAIRG